MISSRILHALLGIQNNLNINISKYLGVIFVNQSMHLTCLGTTLGFVLSVNQSWMKAMNTCAHHNQAPFDPGKAYTSEKQWMGTAKYKTSFGKILVL